MDRTIAPLIKPLSHFELQQAESITLGNGVKFHTLSSGTQPLIRLEVVFNAGAKYDVKPGVSFVTSKMLQEGTASFTSAEIQEKIAGLGAFLEIHHSVERINLTFYIPSKYIQDLLPLLKEIMLYPSFPLDNFNSIINISKNHLKVNLQKNSFLASQELKKALFGEDHYYGHSTQEEELSVITLSDVTFHYENTIQNFDFEVFVSGFIEDELSASLKDFFNGLKVEKSVKNFKKPVESNSVRKILIEKSDALQSSIRIGKMLFNRSHNDYFKALITNEILGGYFGSRLMKNIREEKGLTYGISSQLVSLEESGYFVIGTDVKKEFTQMALDEIYKEIEILQREALSDEELDTVSSYMHGSYLGSINSSFALMDKYKTIYYSHLDYSYYAKYIQTLKEIKQSDIMEVAQKYFSGLNEIVVGNYQ